LRPSFAGTTRKKSEPDPVSGLVRFFGGVHLNLFCHLSGLARIAKI
jgi:hypothetical protein